MGWETVKVIIPLIPEGSSRLDEPTPVTEVTAGGGVESVLSGLIGLTDPCKENSDSAVDSLPRCFITIYLVANGDVFDAVDIVAGLPPVYTLFESPGVNPEVSF